MQLYRDRATVWFLLSDHDHEIVAIHEDAEIVFGDQFPGRATDVQSVLCFSIGIPTRSDHDLG